MGAGGVRVSDVTLHLLAEDGERFLAREYWLNGFNREGDTVMVFPTIRCAGCGVGLGTVCYMPGDEAPPPPPTWPFEEAACPLCRMRARVNALPPGAEDRLLTRMIALRKCEQAMPPPPLSTIYSELLETLPVSDIWLYMQARVKRTADGLLLDDLSVTQKRMTESDL